MSQNIQSKLQNCNKFSIQTPNSLIVSVNVLNHFYCPTKNNNKKKKKKKKKKQNKKAKQQKKKNKKKKNNNNNNIWAASWQYQQNDCSPSEDSDQLGHPAGADQPRQADLNLRWAHSHFVGFVMRRLILVQLQTKVPSCA